MTLRWLREGAVAHDLRDDGPILLFTEGAEGLLEGQIQDKTMSGGQAKFTVDLVSREAAQGFHVGAPPFCITLVEPYAWGMLHVGGQGHLCVAEPHARASCARNNWARVRCPPFARCCATRCASEQGAQAGC